MTRCYTAVPLVATFLALASSELIARVTGGTKAVVSNVTHSAASVSASITTDSTEMGTVTLRFFLRAPGASTGFFVAAAPASIPVNGNTTTIFTGALNDLSCGTSYEVTGAYTNADGQSFTVTPSPAYTLFSTLPCATLTLSSSSVKVFVGNPIAPVALTATHFNGAPSFRITPNLTPGLVFDSATGRVSGTPTAAQTETRHTITAQGAVSGSASATLALTIAPTLTDLEVLRYVASHSDLIEVFGLNIDKARQHYLEWGFNEGRNISFEPLYYTASHPDLMAAFDVDEKKVVTHYIQFGYKEQRQIAFSELTVLRYIASHPDLIEALGADPGKGIRHYINWGFKEGRSITFDPLRYTASHADLINAFGGDERKATAHYIQWGYKENRQITFRPLDALNYIASSIDLIASIGADAIAGIRHYVQTGFREGRRIVFDALAYIASHVDLISAYGTDALAGVTHYINWGFKEGRRITFDALGYLAAHADLRAAFGSDTVAATQHYINWGAKEGRNYLWTVSVTAGAGGQVSASRLYANNGERVSLTVTPQPGFAVETMTGCGGSLSGSSYTTAPVTGTCAITASFKLITITGSLSADCVGANCAAVNGTTYAGTGIGVWRYANTSASNPALVDVSLTGVRGGNTVTLVFSNGSKTSASTLPGFGLAPSVAAASSTRPQTQSFGSSQTEVLDPHEAAHSRILESNRNLISTLGDSAGRGTAKTRQAGFSAPPRTSEAPALGAQRTWKDAAFDTTVDYATSVRATCSAATGRNIVFWVDDLAWTSGKVTSSVIDKFKNTYCGSIGGYERLVKLYGEPWGTHSFSDLISDSPTLQDLNIVMVSSTESYAGYFWGLNTFKENPKSNKALAFFINVRQFSGDTTPASMTNFFIGTLVHEMMHMVNFYQRAIRRGAYHDTWLEETSAMMSEDIITPALVGYNKIATDRLPTYLRSGGNVSYINWSQLSGNHYGIGGAFGAFMNRRYGLSFFRALQTCSSDSVACVDSFINLNGGGSFANEFARMGASLFSLLPATALPAQYGFPSRTDGEYSFEAINLAALSQTRPVTGSALSAGYRATSQTFVTDTVASGESTYTRNGVLVPAGTSLTVVVR